MVGAFQVHKTILVGLVIKTECRLVALICTDSVQADRHVVILIGRALNKHLLKTEHRVLRHSDIFANKILANNCSVQMVKHSGSTHFV